MGNADILSNSWNYVIPPGTIQPIEIDVISTAIADAMALGRLRNGVRLGCVVVFGSGNFNQSFNGVAFPARLPGVITVGAINKNGAILDYSSRGAEMDLVAPSGNIQGDVNTTDRMGTNGYNSGNYMNNFGGTSAACPQVSGVAALILSANPTLTQAQVRTILQNTATDMGTTGFDNTFGFGRLNAQAALQAVTNGIFINNGGNLICTNTPISVNISGSNNIVWTSSSNITINGTGTNVTASSNSSGQGWIEARINGALCGLRRTVWAGRIRRTRFYAPGKCQHRFTLLPVMHRSAELYSGTASQCGYYPVAVELSFRLEWLYLWE
ncbi:MAG: S8 family serine peptidase [Cyclobacteriaceae bacterium]|nr:S8 family serine peptidase [Cyclobacteriaceae bacterium]